MKQREESVDNPYLAREIEINRLRDILVFVPLLAVIFFLSPILNLVNIDASLLGIPLRVLQIFLVWLLVILILRRTSIALRKLIDERE